MHTTSLESYKQAARPLENELKLRPDNRSAAMLLGLTLFRLGNYAKASELLSGAANLQSTDSDIQYALASSLIRQGKTEAADQVIEQLRTTSGDVPELHLLQAEKYDASGDRAKALAELGEVASSNQQHAAGFTTMPGSFI